MKIETKLHEEIAKELDELGKIQLGSDEYRGVVDGVTKLMDRAIEIERLDMELQDKEETRHTDEDLRLKQMNDENKDRIVKNLISVMSFVVPTAVTIWGTIKTIEFEKEGTITTIMGRGFVNKLLPKK